MTQLLPTSTPSASDATELRWGILGPGSIARAFAKGLANSRTGRLVAAGSRDAARAQEFLEANAAASKGQPAVAHGSYEALLADPHVDAVYISTPHPQHPRWAIAAARAGKHILVEKPIAVNRASAMAVFEAARVNDVFAMEAYMYRCHPQTVKLAELIADGAIGRVLSIQAAFAFATGSVDPSGRLFDRALAGGGILDVGGYPVSLARLVAGAARGVAGEAKPFADPTKVVGGGTLTDTGVDDFAVAVLSFDDGLTATVTTGVGLSESSVRITGTGGIIDLAEPWLPSRDGRGAGVTLRRVRRDVEEIAVDEPELYSTEVDHVAAHLADRQGPAMSWADSLGNLAVTDSWRRQVGVVFDDEGPAGDFAPVDGGRVAVVTNPSMPYAEIPGIETKASRIVLGVDNQTELPHASVMFDDFVERGGRTFDTAYIYGRGRCEPMLGQWMANRGIRDDLVIIGKGAHTPHCDPESIGTQLTESLERLQTDHVDQYFMHRDNTDVPVGEFVDAMDAELVAGRIRAFGGSNWSIQRFEEANAYADANGKHRLTALSNHLSLAQAYDVPWAGCAHVSDPDSKAWLEETQTPLFPWSSQARGFFTGRATPTDRGDEELVRCFYSDENFERLRRANELGTQLGVPATAVALAWLLHLPFPVFPLIGPRHVSETVSSLEGLSISLSPEQVRWLDLQDA